MYSFMENSPFGGQAIFKPQLLDMDKRALPGAEQQMLQGGEHEEVVFAIHFFVSCLLNCCTLCNN